MNFLTGLAGSMLFLRRTSKCSCLLFLQVDRSNLLWLTRNNGHCFYYLSMRVSFGRNCITVHLIVSHESSISGAHFTTLNPSVSVVHFAYNWPSKTTGRARVQQPLFPLLNTNQRQAFDEISAMTPGNSVSALLKNPKALLLPLLCQQKPDVSSFSMIPVEQARY